MRQDIIDIIQSWDKIDSELSSLQALHEWIREMNRKILVDVRKIELRDDGKWFYNCTNGYIENRMGRFFSIRGIRFYREGELALERPIIYQPEIGYLGIICKKINGTMYFLMQAKVEPGNVNCVQISPTIQATRSNFSKAHGGNAPKYLEYFACADKYTIVFDQVQSEQGARFYKKRNRNIMIRVDEDIEIHENFRWMTLGQIKELMKEDNLVNMDTRTVLSCIPLATYRFDKNELKTISGCFRDQYFFRSVFGADMQDGIVSVYKYLNNAKMFADNYAEFVPLSELKEWVTDKRGITCETEAAFDVRYFDIAISGREVQRWEQPLLCARGIGMFGLFICLHEGIYRFLVSARMEAGVFDTAEIGPTIFTEPGGEQEDNFVVRSFAEQLRQGEGVICDCLFSEEGGRFYHEQNRNVILMTDYIKPSSLPKGYFWLSYSSLNGLVQINNCLNIQLRNLLSILPMRLQKSVREQTII